MICLVCHSTMGTGLAPWHTVCPACGYEASSLAPRINEPDAHETMDEAARARALREVRRLNFQQIVNALRALPLPEHPRLLDVGSAHGWFLEEAAGTFDVLGIEPDRLMSERSRREGLPVREGLFPDVLEAAERFDVIVFNDVLEHLVDLPEALEACCRHLSAGGLLVINLPNSRGAFYRIAKLLARAGRIGPFERLWQKGLPSPHLHYFSPDNLARLLEAHGFTSRQAFAIPSITLDHLHERIAYANPRAGARARVANGLTYLAIWLAYPLLGRLESDTHVGIFSKRAGPAT